MTIPDIAAADRDRFFADWGIPATLREITQFADPALGRLEEFATNSALTVVGGHHAMALSAETAAAHQLESARFLVRTSELPANVSWPRSRLAVGPAEFAILGETASPIDGTVLLTCKAI